MARRQSGGSGCMGLVLIVIFVAVVVAMVHATLETPSGDGVSTPADWARQHEQSQTGP